MLFVLSTYGMALLQVLFPLYLAFQLWRIPIKTLKHWLFRFSFLLSAIILFYLIGRWDITGYELRFWFYGLIIVLGVSSLARVFHLPFSERNSNGGMHWGFTADFIILMALVLWAYSGHYPGEPAVQPSPPLKGVNYVVMQGGDTYPVNYHGLFAEPQRYALDIVEVNKWGFRAKGIYPVKLEKYSIYTDTVYSPADGLVVESRNCMPDQNPPHTNGDKPYGNYLWIKSDSLYFVLAHLKKGSLQVSRGDSIRSGQPVALVGNTGNTSEPHLHMHAVSFAEEVNAVNGSKIYAGKAVPIRIDGKFLSRNQKIP